jgi:hypothetical protein
MARRFNPYLIDRSADYLSKSIQGAVTAFDTQMANIEKSKNELALQDAELKRISTSLSADNEQNFKDDLSDAVNAEIDKIYKLGYNSIGRDQTEYLKAQSNLLNGIKELQSGLAIFDEESKEYQKIKNSGLGQFKISNTSNPKARAFLDNIALNNGNGTKIGYQNGSFTLGHSGYSVNISNYMNSRKNGAEGMVSYVGDPSKEYEAIYNKHAKKYSGLTKKIQTQLANGKISTETSKEYDAANKQIREELMNDPNLLTSISGDEYQYLSQFSNNIDPNEPFKGTPDQIKKALDAKVELIMQTYSKENEITSLTESVRAPMSEYQARQLRLQRKKFEYEKQLDASNKAEFESGIDFYLNRNLDHARKMREKGLFEPDKINTKETADKIAKLLGEGSAFTYKSLEGEIVDGEFEPLAGSGKFFVIDPEEQVVEGANTPVGLVDLLNQGTIYAQLDANDASKAANYVTSRMPELSENKSKKKAY